MKRDVYQKKPLFPGLVPYKGKQLRLAISRENGLVQRVALAVSPLAKTHVHHYNFIHGNEIIDQDYLDRLSREGEPLRAWFVPITTLCDLACPPSSQSTPVNSDESPTS